MKYKVTLTDITGKQRTSIEIDDIKYLDHLMWSAACAVGLAEGQFKVHAIVYSTKEYHIDITASFGTWIILLCNKEYDALFRHEWDGSLQDAIRYAEHEMNNFLLQIKK